MRPIFNVPAALWQSDTSCSSQWTHRAHTYLYYLVLVSLRLRSPGSQVKELFAGIDAVCVEEAAVYVPNPQWYEFSRGVKLLPLLPWPVVHKNTRVC